MAASAEKERVMNDLDLPDKMVEDEHLRNEIYLYLEELRESGETNMFGAGVYLQKDFELSKDKAITYLSDWMKQYNDELQNIVDQQSFEDHKGVK